MSRRDNLRARRCPAASTARVAILLAVAASAHAASAERQTAEARDRAREYLELGEKEAGAHRYDEAIAHYDAAIQLQPDYAEAYNDRGHAYHWKGNSKDLAIADFTRAIALRLIYPNAYNNRGVTTWPVVTRHERFLSSTGRWR